MYSFYGGPPGNPFVIITTFRSVEDMVTAFQSGSNYTVVHFNQYVMINTVNKNDPDNGKIYRRGYDFTNNMGGAELIGTIVGPAGKAPMLEMTTIENVRKKHAAQNYEERRSSGSYSLSTNNLVPGKNIDGTFNDNIRWECCSIRNENNEDTTAYIGFTFPYPVIDFESSSISPYSDGQYMDTSGASRVDNYNHPFYEKWHFDIPKGVKGDSFGNLKVQIADDTIEPYDGQEEDILNQNEVFVYEQYNYDIFQDGDPKKYYAGTINSISQMAIDNNQHVLIWYSDPVKRGEITYNDKTGWVDIGAINVTNYPYRVTFTYSNQNIICESTFNNIRQAYQNNRIVYGIYENELYILKQLSAETINEVTTTSLTFSGLYKELKKYPENTIAENESFIVTMIDRTPALQEQLKMIAPFYSNSNSVSYKLNDIVIYSPNSTTPKHLYKCISPTTGGQWVSNCWQQTTLINALA